MTITPAQTEIDESTKDQDVNEIDESHPKDQDLNDKQVNVENDEERLNLLESRVLECEQICGIPEPNAPRCEQYMMSIVFQVHHKLLIFGTWHATALALLILAANMVFVIAFSIHQMRNTCSPTIALIDGDLPGYAYQYTYVDPGHIFLCTTASFNEDADNTTIDSECDFWKRWTPCTLRGLTSKAYNLNADLCPVSYNGCYRNLNCDVKNNETMSNGTGTDIPTTPVGGLANVCDGGPAGLHDAPITCQGLVSVSYYSCPSPWTVIGAALGYSALVQMAMLMVVVVLYLLIRALMGRAPGLNDMLTAMDSPGTTADEVMSSRRQQQEMALASKRDHGDDNGDNDENEERKEDDNENSNFGGKSRHRNPETA